MTKHLAFSAPELAFMINALSVSAAATRKTIIKAESEGRLTSMYEGELNLLESMISRAVDGYSEIYRAKAGQIHSEFVNLVPLER